MQGWLNSVALEEQDLWCKKKGFVSQRQDGIQNLLKSLLSKVCKDVEVEPHLLPMDIDVFNLSSAVTSPEARLDIKAGSFWSRGETYSSMYVMHLNSTCNQNKSKESIFVEQREEKEVPTKSYGRGNGIFPPPPPTPPPPCGFWHKRRNGEKMQTFSEQPSGQTLPKQRRVVCQCHILA